ncbi:uncharacterized protein LOC142350711 [Convolutriloba macropyga]|uniref:uncharacterized protein LOC142350711 n=1 Tax=Convolutriloba macropyga TaxID=536237 RepID=UPI003F523CEE
MGNSISKTMPSSNVAHSIANNNGLEARRSLPETPKKSQLKTENQIGIQHENLVALGNGQSKQSSFEYLKQLASSIDNYPYTDKSIRRQRQLRQEYPPTDKKGRSPVRTIQTSAPSRRFHQQPRSFYQPLFCPAKRS